MKPVLILSLGVRGGSLVYAQEIIDRLSIEKTVIVSANSDVKVPSFDYQWITHKNSYEFLFYSLTLLPIYLLKIIYDLTRARYSALYLPYLHFWSIFFILVFKVFGKKSVITVHDGILHGKNGISLIQNLTNLCIRVSDELIFLSEHVKIGVQEKLAPKGNLYVIPHGLIVPLGLEQHFRNHKVNPNLLFFGKVLRSKGIENLISAVLGIEETKYNKLFIVGKHYYYLDRDIDSNKIIFVDTFVQENEIANFFNNANILVLPYTEASQSGVVTIGIAACIPMICTRVGGLKEQLDSGSEAIFVDPETNSIRDGILNLIENKELYESISMNLQKKQNNLEWKTIAISIEKVILSAIVSKEDKS
jgi:glycosyltransferase involved in cell wall biosynthesis